MGNLGKCGSEAASHDGARAFSSSSLVKSMEITAVIQYILTAAQSFGSQEYCNMSMIMMLGHILVCYSSKMSRR